MNSGARLSCRPLPAHVQARYESARQPGVGSDAPDRRRRRAHQIRRPQDDTRRLLSPGFTLGAFKGQGLTVRPWNQQLRQPILLTDGQGTVSVSPQEGFLHQTSELDTLGFDRPETKCKLQ